VTQTRARWKRAAAWAGAGALVVAATFGLYVAVGGLDKPAEEPPAEARDVEQMVTEACQESIAARAESDVDWHSAELQQVGGLGGYDVSLSGTEIVSGQQFGPISATCSVEVEPGGPVNVLDNGFTRG
jgi:hypothetical protein